MPIDQRKRILISAEELARLSRKRSDLVILAARPSMGKTTLALNIAAHAALRHGRTVGVFSLEKFAESEMTFFTAS